jgi:hypothetical protein
MLQDYVRAELEKKLGKPWDGGNLWKEWAIENYRSIKKSDFKKLNLIEYKGKDIPIFEDCDITFLSCQYVIPKIVSDTTAVQQLKQIRNCLAHGTRKEATRAEFDSEFHQLQEVATLLLTGHDELNQKWQTKLLRIKFDEISKIEASMVELQQVQEAQINNLKVAQEEHAAEIKAAQAEHASEIMEAQDTNAAELKKSQAGHAADILGAQKGHAVDILSRLRIIENATTATNATTTSSEIPEEKLEMSVAHLTDLKKCQRITGPYLAIFIWVTCPLAPDNLLEKGPHPTFPKLFGPKKVKRFSSF